MKKTVHPAQRDKRELNKGKKLEGKKLFRNVTPKTYGESKKRHKK